MNSGVGIFVKNPAPGKVKTRLLPFVSADEAARLYGAFLRDTIHNVSRIQCHARFIAYWPEEARATVQELAPHGFMLCLQQGANLGQRMSRFFDWCFGHGLERVVLIGSDSPTLPMSFLEDALESLYDVPVVLGPCYDGGYYLIGLSRAIRGIFDKIDWSSDRVFAQTISRLKKAGEGFRILNPWYDVDTPESLRFLVNHVDALAESKSEELPRFTYEVVKDLRMNGDEKQQ